MISWRVVIAFAVIAIVIYHFATAKKSTAPSVPPVAPVAPVVPAPLIAQPVGASVWCSKNDPLQLPNSAVYRVISGDTIAYYPSPDIASTWNPTWSAQIKPIDCTGVKFQGFLQRKQ